MKEFFRRNFPRFFIAARSVKDQLQVEGQVVRQVGLRVLVERVAKAPSDWRKTLPLQSLRIIELDAPELSNPSDLVTWMEARELDFAQGGHTIYLPPATLSVSPLAALAALYPAGAGLKVMKNVGGPNAGSYVHGGEFSEIHRRLTHCHSHLTIVANLLTLNNLGPRLFDLIELRLGGQSWTAYVVEHCEGRVPSVSECEEAMGTLRRLQEERLIRVSAPGGFEHMDFRCPGCNGNAVTEYESGKFRYFDFQNLLLVNYGRYLESLAIDAAQATHFGHRSVLRGGRYLYQSIPGVGLPAKRSVAVRAEVFRQLLDSAGCSVRDQLVLDIGCNIGMMSALYLQLGAAWVHGWDQEYVACHTERLLLALGCTRFSLTPGLITSDQPVSSDVPPHAARMLDGCVISYLAIRGHIGWIDALASINWSFLIYEGHEGETEADFYAFMDELRRKCQFDIAARSTYEDGDCSGRHLAILARVHSRCSTPHVDAT